MKKFIQNRRNAYFIVALTAFFLTVLLGWAFTAGSNQALYLREIKQRLNTEIKVLNEDIAPKFKQEFQRLVEINFSQLGDASYKYPLYVYKSGNLVYWSDFKYDIPYSTLQGNYLEKCIKQNGSESILFVKRTSLIINNEDYEIFLFIPLRNNYDIENKYLIPGLNSDIFPNQKTQLALDESKGEPVYYERNFATNKSKTYLFSIQYPQNFLYYADKSWVVFFFGSISLLMFTLFVGSLVTDKFQNQQGVQGIILLVGTIVGLRTLMLLFDFPYKLTQFPLFSHEGYNATWLTPSLGDLWLNIFSVFLILFFAIRFFTQWFPYKNILKLNPSQRNVLAILLIVITYTTVHGVYFVIKGIYQNSALSLDINQSIRFDLFRIVGFVVFVLSVAIYFAISHLASKLLVRLSNSLYGATINFVMGSIIYYLTTILLNFDDLLLFNINAVYIALITFLGMPQSLNRTGYKSLIYLIVCSIVGAIAGAYAIYDFEQERDIKGKEFFANQLVLKRDAVGEIHLRNLMQKIKQDKFVQQKMVVGLPFRRELIEQRIKKIHLDSYLEKYNTEVQLFNGVGTPFFEDGQNFFNIQSEYDRQEFRTEYRNIYYSNELKREQKQYTCFVSIKDEKGQDIGNIILKLRLKKMIPNSVNQSFLVDKKYKDVTQTEIYSYAIYSDKELIYSFGDFAYDNSFLNNFLHEKGFFLSELVLEKYHHLRIRLDDQVIVISSTTYPNDDILANFSFLFLLLVFTILSSYFIYGISRTAYYNLTFATKVQLYLNLAFFVPLLIVSIITISILNNTNERETQFYFLEKARNVSESDNLISTITAYNQGRIGKDQLLLEIANIADFTQSDINLYDKSGKILATSQSYLFDHNLLSNYINPQAYAGIVEQKQRKMLIPEQLGELSYHSAYVGIQSYETGDVMGIVGIPFFGASSRFESQIIEVLATIVQVFTFIFIVLVLLSYFSAKSLIHPIRLITQKIRRTSLKEVNEPLDYHADDEFGLLAGEYNKMISKLEESKEALALSEKEAAWREMAKQVAHEIKNPLTPMKLTLQQLQRRLGTEGSGTSKPLHTLLEQVDILSDIATSFSSFAQMPIPIREEFEIASVLRKTLDLHDVSREIDIVVDIPEDEFYIVGDSQLTYRIFTNLLLNGIQSIPNERNARLEVSLTPLYPQRILIEIKDNGEGIPQHIQHKVFMPNFTTKTSGSGIGLAVAKRGIEHSGGSIWFETERDEGTTFFIELPLCEYKPQKRRSTFKA